MCKSSHQYIPYKRVIIVTAPYITTVWKTYKDLTHTLNSTNTNASITSPSQSQASSTPKQPPRLLIISGNSGTLSLQTVQENPPNKYHTLRRAKRPRSHPPHQRTQPTITDLFTNSLHRTTEKPPGDPLPPPRLSPNLPHPI